MRNMLSAIAALVLTVCVGNSTVLAQNPPLPKPTEVIDSFIDAVGGETAIRAIKTIEASAQLGRDEITYIYHDSRFLFETTFEGSPQRVRTGYDGKDWWLFGKNVSTENDQNNLTLLQYAYAFPPDAIRFREMITDQNFIESTTIDGKASFRIKVESGEGLTIWLTFDAQSKLLAQRTEMIGDGCATVKYSYREIDGILFVDKVTGGFSCDPDDMENQVVQSFGRIEVNGNVDETRLDLLKSPN